MKLPRTNRPPSTAAYVAGFLGWLLPGAGYMYLGLRTRGIIICATVCATYFLGLLIGGVEMAGPQHSVPWFLAQVLAGLPALTAVILQDPNIQAGFGRGVDLGQLYTSVAGLLNLLCVVDTVMRAYPADEQAGPQSKK